MALQVTGMTNQSVHTLVRVCLALCRAQTSFGFKSWHKGPVRLMLASGRGLCPRSAMSSYVQATTVTYLHAMPARHLLSASMNIRLPANKPDRAYQAAIAVLLGLLAWISTSQLRHQKASASDPPLAWTLKLLQGVRLNHTCPTLLHQHGTCMQLLGTRHLQI